MSADYYKKQAATHYELYQQAVENGDKVAQKQHMKEYLNYTGAIKND